MPLKDAAGRGGSKREQQSLFLGLWIGMEEWMLIPMAPDCSTYSGVQAELQHCRESFNTAGRAATPTQSLQIQLSSRPHSGGGIEAARRHRYTPHNVKRSERCGLLLTPLGEICMQQAAQTSPCHKRALQTVQPVKVWRQRASCSLPRVSLTKCPLQGENGRV